MCWQDILFNILISLVSSLTIWFFLQFYTFGARNKINSLLIILRDECVAFEKYLKYFDYDNALQISRRILDKTCVVFNIIKPLTYIKRKKRLLINTLLNNIYLICHRFIYKEIGYSDDMEKTACCKKMVREIFIIGAFPDKSTSEDLLYYEPITSISAKILIDLNLYRAKRINTILRDGFFFNASPTETEILKKYYDKLININLFKNNIVPSIGKIYYLTNDTLTQVQYNKIIKNLDKKNNNNK